MISMSGFEEATWRGFVQDLLHPESVLFAIIDGEEVWLTGEEGGMSGSASGLPTDSKRKKRRRRRRRRSSRTHREDAKS